RLEVERGPRRPGDLVSLPSHEANLPNRLPDRNLRCSNPLPNEILPEMHRSDAMRAPRRFPRRSIAPITPNRAVRPDLDGLERRHLLSPPLVGKWTYGSRITSSFMPDGTSIGGPPSALFRILGTRYAATTWQQQIEQAASLWEGATNINLALVSDNGAADGSN